MRASLCQRVLHAGPLDRRVMWFVHGLTPPACLSRSAATFLPAAEAKGSANRKEALQRCAQALREARAFFGRKSEVLRQRPCFQDPFILLPPPPSPMPLRRSLTQGSGTFGAEPALQEFGRSMSGGSGISGYSGTSGATSRYSTKVLLISAEEFDMTLEGLQMSGGWR